MRSAAQCSSSCRLASTAISKPRNAVNAALRSAAQRHVGSNTGQQVWLLCAQVAALVVAQVTAQAIAQRKTAQHSTALLAAQHNAMQRTCCASSITIHSARFGIDVSTRCNEHRAAKRSTAQAVAKCSAAQGCTALHNAMLSKIAQCSTPQHNAAYKGTLCSVTQHRALQQQYERNCCCSAAQRSTAQVAM